MTYPRSRDEVRALRRAYADAETDAEFEPALTPRPKVVRLPEPEPNPFTLLSLDELAAESDGEPEWLIGAVWPYGGKIILSAPAKSGKSTLVGNLIRSHVDGVPFLDRFPVQALGEGECVTLVDTELPGTMITKWLDGLGISTAGRARIRVIPLRGRRFDPADDEQYDRLGEALYPLGGPVTRVLIFDPLGPMLRGAGRDENRPQDLAPVLAAFDDLLDPEASLRGLLVCHHHGHNGERSRGASVLRDWPDAEWIMTRDGDRRSLRMSGRDVDVPDTPLIFDRATRRLSLGEGTRQAATDAAHRAAVVAIVAERPGVTSDPLADAVREAIGGNVTKARAVIRSALDAGVIHRHRGKARAQHHLPGSTCPTCGNESDQSDQPMITSEDQLS